MKKVDKLRVEQLIEINKEGPPPEGMTLAEAQEIYKIEGFSAPYVVVTRRSDGVKGTLAFTHNPRRYFNFQEHKA